MTENIEYYKARLNFIKKLFRDHEISLLQKNASKIKVIVDGYNKFKSHLD